MAKKTILVTLANGKQCRSLLPFLFQDPNLTVRAFVHSKSSEKSLREYVGTVGNAANLKVVIGDLLVPADITRAVEGVDTIFHVGPPMSPHEHHIGVLVIKAAEKAGVQHFIFSSVLHPIRSKLLNHDIKRLVEEYLIESSLNWTILQPTHVMQNTKPAEAAKNGFLSVPYNPDNEMGFVDLRDMGEVVQTILREPEKHYRARYELCGENMSYTEYARKISEVSGKKVEIKKGSAVEVAKQLGGGDRDYEDRFARMLFYYDRWGLVGNSNILRWLLGHEPRTLEGYIADSLAGKV
jgi:uncharacterized protein YbjT (DUF2867 family)